MILTFRPIKIWPEGWPNHRGKTSQFGTSYGDTLLQLERELEMLNARSPILQVDASERDCRLDGQLRADARVGYRGVILSFRTPEYGTLTYPCDAFTEGYGTRRPAWQENLRAITLGLESLRRVERYGIANRGQQYAGYAELGRGMALGNEMTILEAARFIAGHGDAEEHFQENVNILLQDGQPLSVYVDALGGLFRRAALKLHPDNGGDANEFARLTKAKDLLIERVPTDG
jgi:hypothetical protein